MVPIAIGLRLPIDRQFAIKVLQSFSEENRRNTLITFPRFLPSEDRRETHFRQRPNSLFHRMAVSFTRRIKSNM